MDVSDTRSRIAPSHYERLQFCRVFLGNMLSSHRVAKLVSRRWGGSSAMLFQSSWGEPLQEVSIHISHRWLVRRDVLSCRSLPPRRLMSVDVWQISVKRTPVRRSPYGVNFIEADCIIASTFLS